MANKKQIEVIPPKDRAAQAMSVAGTKEKLAELASQSAELVAVTDQDSRKLVHDSMMVLKNTRISIEKAGKAGREDATAYSKAVIEIEKDLIRVIEPEEERLKKLRDDFDAIAAAELAAIQERERIRVAEINSRIAAIRNAPSGLVGANSAAIQVMIDWLGEQDLDTFESPHLEEARDAFNRSIDYLMNLHGKTVQAEADAVALAARKAELDARQAEIDRQAAVVAAEQAEARRREDERVAAANEQIASRQAELDRKEQEHATRLREQAEADAAAAAKKQLEEDERLLAELAKAEAEEIAGADLYEAIQDAVSYIRNTAGVDSKVYKKLVTAAGRHFNQEIV